MGLVANPLLLGRAPEDVTHELGQDHRHTARPSNVGAEYPLRYRED